MLVRLKKFLLLPTVVDLGWSEVNALPSRQFSYSGAGLTWEDYYVEMKKRYPVRFFIFHTVARALTFHVLSPMKRFKHNTEEKYLLRSHMLDLRQSSWVNGCDDYDGGYIDPTTQMLYACMATLDRFVSEAKPTEQLEFLEAHLSQLDPESDERPIIEDQIKFNREVLRIHNWWNVERKKEFLQLTREQDYAMTKEERRVVYAKWDAHEAREDEMLMCLVRIRRSLWS